MTKARVDALTDANVRLEPGNLEGLDALAAEAIGVFCFSDVRPLAGVAGFLDWRAAGSLSRCLESGTFAGNRGDCLLFPAFGRGRCRRLFVFGLGPVGDCDRGVFREVVRRAVEVMRGAGSKEIVLAAPAKFGASSLESDFVRVVGEEIPGKVLRVLVSD